MLSICAKPEEIYLKDNKLKPEDVQILQEWLQKQAHLPKLTDIQVILFLHYSRCSIEAAKPKFERYLSARAHSPYVFARLPSDQLKITSAVALGCILPKHTPQGYFISFVKLLDFRPENFISGDLVQFINMVSVLYLHQNGPQDGVIIVFDFKGFTFGHLARVNWLFLKHFVNYLQGAIPVRIKGIHYINATSILDKVLTFLKPLLKSKLYNRIQLHTSFDTFFNYVPRECMPVEYGGEAPSSQILQERTLNLLLSNYEFFEWHDSQILDESKRLEELNNPLFGVDGTFKKLEID